MCEHIRELTADIPFVRLRDHLPESALLHTASFSDVVSRLAIVTGDVRVVLDCPRLRIVVNGRECVLSPREFAFYLWFALRKQSGMDSLHAPIEDYPDADAAREYLEAYRMCVGELRAMEDNLSGGMPLKFFEQTKSRLKSALTQAYGSLAHNQIGLASRGRGKGFYLALPLERLEILRR